MTNCHQFKMTAEDGKVRIKSPTFFQHQTIHKLRNPLFCHSKKAYSKILEDLVDELSELQGMDTSGKDGAIRHVMSGVNPQGCQVFSFKQPSHNGTRVIKFFLHLSKDEQRERLLARMKRA